MCPDMTERSAMAEQVYETLLNRLISGTVPPGARLSVDGLARELGVSQTPIRRALTFLEAEGLVISTHLSGYTASPRLTAEEFEELFEVRHLLEPSATARAATHRTEDDLDRIVQLADAMRALRAADLGLEYSTFARLDSQFHQAIAEASGNAILARSIYGLHAHVHMFRLMFNTSVTSEAIDEHEAIVQALREGRADDAALATAVHLQSSRQRLYQAF